LNFANTSHLLVPILVFAIIGLLHALAWVFDSFGEPIDASARLVVSGIRAWRKVRHELLDARRGSHMLEPRDRLGRTSSARDFSGNGVTTNQEFEPMRRSNFALRLQPSLLDELRKAAEAEGVAINQLINVAVAEKVSALCTEDYFRERDRRADRAETLRILERAGKGNPAMKGDELPAEWQTKPGRQATDGRDSVSKRGQKKRPAPK
jgi:hypothetical protein